MANRVKNKKNIKDIMNEFDKVIISRIYPVPFPRMVMLDTIN